MNNQTSIKYISALLENPNTITEGDQNSIALFRQTYPYFIPGRYLVALENHKKKAFSPQMLSGIQPYVGNWVMFCDFLEAGNRELGEQLSAINKVVDKKKVGVPAEPEVAPVQSSAPISMPPVTPVPEVVPPVTPIPEIVPPAVPIPEIVPPVTPIPEVEPPVTPIPEEIPAVVPIPEVVIPVAQAPEVVSVVAEKITQAVDPIKEAVAPIITSDAIPQLITEITKPVQAEESPVVISEIVSEPPPLLVVPLQFTDSVIQRAVAAVTEEPIESFVTPTLQTEIVVPPIADAPVVTAQEAISPEIIINQLPEVPAIAASVSEPAIHDLPVAFVIDDVPAIAAESIVPKQPTVQPDEKPAAQPMPVFTEISSGIHVQPVPVQITESIPAVPDAQPVVTPLQPPVQVDAAEKSAFAQAWADEEKRISEIPAEKTPLGEAIEIVSDTKLNTDIGSDTSTNQDTLIFPIYTRDYFLQQGEKVSEEIPVEINELKEPGTAEDEEKALMVVMSFSEWLLHFKSTSEKQKEESKDQRALKTMWQKEKLAAAMEEENEEIPENVFEMAVNSISKEDGLVSETLAEIHIKQGKYDKAIEMYRKLSLRNPQKSAYFAGKIEETLKDKQS